MNQAADHAGERAKPRHAAWRSAPIAALDRPRPGNMRFILHDSPQEFRIVITGDLAGSQVQSLEWAWETGKSILRGRALVVDICGITTADSAGGELLRRMRDSGAHVTPALELRPEGFPSLAGATPGPRVRRRIPCGAARGIVRRLLPAVLAVTRDRLATGVCPTEAGKFHRLNLWRLATAPPAASSDIERRSAREVVK
jgi:hypothetical protein